MLSACTSFSFRGDFVVTIFLTAKHVPDHIGVLDEDSFKANKSGEYYSLSTSILFEKLGFDFKKQSVICDLKREEEADEFVGGEAYRLVSRAPKSRRKTTASTTTAQEQQKEVDKEELL